MAKSKPKKPANPQVAEITKKRSRHVSKKEQQQANARWWREAVESVVIAITLALLFRTFEAEAFVIPTGSMAPTLQGRHKDVVCEKCGFEYRSGASQDGEVRSGLVSMSVCPICRYPMHLDGKRHYNQRSFTGDRILVNKFAYQFNEPRRWDVIVFKFPGNAKQNYIKRLVGLPGETLRIWHGDIYVRPDGTDTFSIARKPPSKLRRILQTVHDTDYVPQQLIDAGWPAPWGPEKSDRGRTGASDWTVSEDHTTYRLSQEASSTETWLRYRHHPPMMRDWAAIEAGRQPRGLQQRDGQLITDFYAYNAGIHRNQIRGGHVSPEIQARLGGLHWVGDLALECEIEVLSDQGQVLLDLVEGGRHYQCRIDVSDGTATLTIDGGEVPFAHQQDGSPPYSLVHKTKVRGPGTYALRLANVDDQLLLWVDNRQIPFGSPEDEFPGAYDPPDDVRPRWSPHDPGDLAPVGIGGKDVSVQVTGLRVLRDVYYIATSSTTAWEPSVDYDSPTSAPHWNGARDMLEEIDDVFRTPRSWANARLFALRRHEDFLLQKDPDSAEKDQFFPMGDNSPQSKDARLWWQSYGEPRVDPWVERRLLTGKAFLIYWPHPWYAGTELLPIVPNVRRMGLIR